MRAECKWWRWWEVVRRGADLIFKIVRPPQVLFLIGVHKEYVAPILTMRKIWIICKTITFLKPNRELRPQSKPKTWNSKKWQDSHKVHRRFHFWRDAGRRGDCRGSKKEQAKFLANSQSPAVGWWTSVVYRGAVDSRGLVILNLFSTGL